MDGCTLKAAGIGDVWIDLPNGSKWTQAILKDTIYAPDMAFTLISISQLEEVDCSVTFKKDMCTIQNPSGCIIATVPEQMDSTALST